MTQKPPIPDRVLIIRPSALGDVCRTVPVLASLRAAWPKAQIDWVVQDEFASAVESHPALNHVIRFPRSQFASWLTHPGRIMEAVGWLRQLRKRRYDLVLDCQGLGRSAVMCAASGAPTRIGLRRAREFAWLAYDLRVPRDRGAPLPVHTVDQMLTLVEAAGVEPRRDMRLHVHQSHQHWWETERTTNGLPTNDTYAVLAPTSRWMSKRWPMDRFAHLVSPLLDRGFARIIVIGSPSEAQQVQPLFDAAAKLVKPGFLLNYVGKTSLAQTMAIIAGAGLVVANDSAPLHMAVGFDRPCVGLFGPTDPAVVGPYGREEAVVRGYAPRPGERINYRNPKLGDALMRLISTVAVLQRIDCALAHSDREARRLTPARAEAAS